MKVELRARPVAYFKITRTQLEVLKQCARLHYDGACQRTLDRVDRPIGNLTTRARENGLLTLWEMFFLYTDEQTPEGVTVDCTGTQADLLAKVTETWVHDQHGDKTAVVNQLHRFFCDLIDLSNRAYNEWKMEVEL
jgi:hypothetical protein